MNLIGDITWFRGDSYPLELLLKDKDTSVPLDLTNYSFLLTVDSLKNPIDNSTKMFFVSGVLDVDPTTGKVSFTPTSINTDIAIATYYYDVQMSHISGFKRTIAKYKWKIVQDITKV